MALNDHKSKWTKSDWLGYAFLASARELTPEVLIVYLDQLGCFTDQEFGQAIQRCMKASSGIPSVASIREWIFVNRGRSVDPKLQHDLSVIGAAQHARRIGWNPEQVQELIDKMDQSIAKN